MPSATYTGPLAAGTVELEGRVVRFVRGDDLAVSDDEAHVLAGDPDWNVGTSVLLGGSAVLVVDDLTGLDKSALLDLVDAEGLDVNRRLGAARLADDIRQARLAQPAQEG